MQFGGPEGNVLQPRARFPSNLTIAPLNKDPHVAARNREWWKRRLLRSRIGGWSLAVREWLQIVRAAATGSPIIGTLANDWLATRLIVKICRPTGTFLDIGAHIGSVVSEVRRRCPQTRIIAIEAMPDKAAALASMYPQVECHAVALGEADGEATLYVRVGETGYSSLRRSGEDAATIPITVPVRTLDGLVVAGDVDAVKMDVEGSELEVLLGGRNLLAACRPTIMFESGAAGTPDEVDRKRRLWKLLAEQGFDVMPPDRVAYHSESMSLDTFIDSHTYPRRTSNYFAIARERRDEIRSRAREALGV